MLAGGEYSTLSQLLGPVRSAQQQWLQSAPLLMIVIVNTWRGIAFAMILITSGLAAIPADVYEAARMDGATTAPNLLAHHPAACCGRPSFSTCWSRPSAPSPSLGWSTR